MGKAIGELIAAMLMIVLTAIVIAWGYQVFWNDVVLNIWQLYTSNDVLTTMKIPYGACVAIAFGVNLIRKQSDDKTLPVWEAISKNFNKLIVKVIMIGVTLLVVSIVF